MTVNFSQLHGEGNNKHIKSDLKATQSKLPPHGARVERKEDRL